MITIELPESHERDGWPGGEPTKGIAVCSHATRRASQAPEADTLFFKLELHRFYGRAPWISLAARRTGSIGFLRRDASMSFHAGLSDVEGIAFDVEFSLPMNFTMAEIVFDELEELDLPRATMFELCVLAAREGSVKAEIVARVHYVGPSQEEDFEDPQLN